MSRYGEEYKYPTTPKVDRLEDRLKLQEDNLNRVVQFMQPVSDPPFPLHVRYEVNQSSNNTVERADMPYVKKSDSPVEPPKPLVAADFKQFIGDIVYDTYEGRYVEVIQVVADVVAVQATPSAEPYLRHPKNLTLF